MENKELNLSEIVSKNFVVMAVHAEDKYNSPLIKMVVRSDRVDKLVESIAKYHFLDGHNYDLEPITEEYSDVDYFVSVRRVILSLDGMIEEDGEIKSVKVE